MPDSLEKRELRIVPRATTDWSGPVFVLGNPRSGTTMFRLVLAAHSEINIPPESAFIVKLFGKYGHVRSFTPRLLAAFQDDLTGPDPVVRLEEEWEISTVRFWTDDVPGFSGSYAELCSRLYRFYSVEKGLGERAIWGDKNNAHHLYVDLLAWLYPNARFIHLVRDGRAVLASYQTLQASSHRRAPRLPRDPAIVAHKWTDAVQRIRRHLAKYAPDRSIEVRYEDVLSDFRREITNVCNFLGLEYEAAMASFHKFNEEHDLEPRSYDAWKGNTRKPADESRAHAWRSALTPEDVHAFEAVAGRTLSAFGYPVEEAPRKTLREGLQTMLDRVREARRRMRLTRVAAKAKLHVEDEK
jgi:hypothetical protein